MTITADTRRSASTAAGPPTSSHLPDDASRTEVVSQYGITPTAPGDPDDGKPDSGAETAAPGGSEPTAADPAAHKPNPPRRRLPPAPVRARVVAGVIDLVIGSLLVGGLTAVIWQVGGRPPLTSGLIAFGVIVGARWLAIAATGWSPGGRLLKVRMLSAQHQAPSPLGSFLHADLILAVSVTTFGLGTIALMRTAATDPEGRGWHDKLSGMALLHARKSSRPGQVATRATAPETRSADSPAVADAVGESRRHTAPHSAQTTTAPVAAPASDGAEDAERSDTEAPSASQPSHGTDQSDAPRSRRRRSQRAEKRSPASGSHTDSASTETRTRAGAGITDGTGDDMAVGVQSATEAGLVASAGGTAHPTTSDPVSSSIRRPRPARPAQPARHAGRAMSAGSHSPSSPRTAPATAAAYKSAISGVAVSADGYGLIKAPRTAKAAKAATVSSPSVSATSAASASPEVSDAAAVAAASATPMDPQASAVLAAAEASTRSAAQSAHQAADGPTHETIGSADSTAQAPSTTASTALSAATEAKAPTRPSSGARSEAPTATTPSVQPAVDQPSSPRPSTSVEPSSTLSSPMEADTATLDAVADDTSEHHEASGGAEAQPTSRYPAAQSNTDGSRSTRTPSAESSKTPTDSKPSEASSSQDATPSTQVPRPKATKPVTSQTMEPRHAHSQRWRTQSGSTDKKTSDPSAAPTKDQREPASQPGVPRRESLFTSERHRFAAKASSAPEVAHTFDTSSILPSGDRNMQALIDSVPWSSVPTSVDAATVDSLPEGGILSEDASPRKTSQAPSRPARLDLTDPAAVPGSVPASTTQEAHPTSHSHPSRTQASGTAAGSASTTPSQTPSQRTHTTHHFQGPGIPDPVEGQEMRGDSHSTSHVDSTEGRAARHESREPTDGTPTHPRTSPAAASSGGPVRTEHSAGTPATAATTTAASSAPADPAPNTSTQTVTPSLPSASSAAPALSVRLAPLLGGAPILIHEPTVVGRDPDNISAYPGAERIALDDPTRSVSKTHAAIFPLLDGVWVTDLHSTNGTRVEYGDGRSIEAVPDKALSALEGSTIFFGRIAFKVEVI